MLRLATSHGVLARLRAGAACAVGGAVLCLHDAAFRVEVGWEGLGAGAGAGTAVPITSDTGAFSFFDPANLEVVVKVLDACAINGHQWVFVTELTDLSTDLRVTRAADGALRRYRRPIGEPATVGLGRSRMPCSRRRCTAAALAFTGEPSFSSEPVIVVSPSGSASCVWPGPCCASLGTCVRPGREGRAPISV